MAASGGLEPHEHLGLELFYMIASIVIVSARFWIIRGQLSWTQPWSKQLGHVAVLSSGILMVTMVAPNLWILVERIHGKGKPGTLDNDLTKSQTVAMLKFLMWNKLDYIVELYVVKVGFLAVYIDVARNLAPSAKLLLWITSVYTVVAFLASFLSSLLFCIPFETNWELVGGCSSFHSLPIVSVQYATNLSTDLLLLAMVYYILHGLRLGRRERLAIGFTIGVALITMVAGTVRFVFLYDFIKGNAKSVASTSNTVFLASEAEMFAALVAVCLPAFRIILRKSKASGSRRNAYAIPQMFSYIGKGRKKRDQYGQTLVAGDVSSETELRTINTVEMGVKGTPNEF